MRTRIRCVALPAAFLLWSQLSVAQATSREFRFEVRDRKGKPVPVAQITFFLTGDSVLTDSSGVARVTMLADSAINITVRKIGYEPRTARFVIGTAPAFTVRVAMGDAGQRLPEVEVRNEYPGEPWREGWLQRKRRGGGQFRDLSNFPGGQTFLLNDWFAGLPGVRSGDGGRLDFPRCQNLGVWIDHQHATSPGNGFRQALLGIAAQDVAAIELYQANPPAQFQGQLEDCSLLIWMRRRN
jgi:hypothetical protein